MNLSFIGHSRKMFVRFCLCIALLIFFSFPTSCATRSTEKLHTLIANAIRSNDFSKFTSANNGFLNSIAKNNDGGLYYIGLHLKDRGYINEARKYFKHGLKRYKAPYNILCEDEFYEIAGISEKLNILKFQKKRAKHKNDVNLMLEIESKANVLRCLNSNYSDLSTDIPVFFANNKLDSVLVRAFEAIVADKEDIIKDAIPDDFFEIMQARAFCYERKYGLAWSIAKNILQTGKIDYLYRNILSDFGKAALFGGQDFLEAANIFENIFLRLEKIDSFSDDIMYVLAFYSARLYTKAGNTYKDLAIHYFEKAESYAPTSANFDNALWYRLKMLQSINFNTYVKEIKRTAVLWNNDYWYDDLIDEIIVTLVQNNKLQDLTELKLCLEQTSLIESIARISYILARSSFFKNNTLAFEKAFERDHNSFYYRVMSAYFLNKPIVSKGYAVKIKRNENSDFSSDEALNILQGYIDYSLFQYVVPMMKKIYPEISSHQAFIFANELNNQELYAQSMSCMQFAMRSEGAEISEKHLKLAYPRPWLASVHKYSIEYGVPEYIIFALMRCESFFKPEVRSHAGAIGLTQLMRPTAEDIARRLRIREYDLNDPDTNIRFGVYYLADMIRRNNGKIMQALFAYNAGPGNVRKWKRTIGHISDDLFLERLPFAETREYGRKVLAATVIYANLYYNKSASTIVNEIFPEL